jgi:hypothetical protein
MLNLKQTQTQVEKVGKTYLENPQEKVDISFKTH